MNHKYEINCLGVSVCSFNMDILNSVGMLYPVGISDLVGVSDPVGV